MILYLNENKLIPDAFNTAPHTEAPAVTTVIAPAMDVTLTEVKLPKLTRARLIQALPYALEEHLLNDINDCHYAIGEYLTSGHLPVAVVTKRKMDEWLNTLSAHKLTPKALIPAPLALAAADPQHWQAVIVDNTCIVRTGPYSGFACDKDNLAYFLTLKQPEVTLAKITLHLRNYTDQAYGLEHPHFNIEELTFPNTQFTQDLQHWVTPSSINLLQNTYRPKRTHTQSNTLWRTLGYVTAGWIGLLFLNPIISFFLLRHENDSLESQIAAIYYHQFPQASAVVAPKKRMTQKLNDLMTQDNKNPFLLWLAYIATTSSHFKEIKIQQLDYRDGQLNMTLSAPNFDNLDRYAQALSQQALSVQQHNIAASGSEVKGNLLITGAKHT